ncbi:MAG: nitroreductase family protein [Halanaerobiales bacterium]|nr:nitroreductase family protein [Halanaerobiales bacterium]
MDVKEAIEKRRAYRSLEPVKIDKMLIKELSEAASLAPSCFNNQPWKYVFV